MISQPHSPVWRASPVLALGAVLAACGCLALAAPSASARTIDAQQETSSNWAGYIVNSSAGDSFSSVTSSWTQPAVSPSAQDAYSAFWVGLGGSSQQSQALEQVGTSSDVINGSPEYYSWYELVPAPETKVDLAVHPGDRMTGTVTVNGSDVTVSLSNQTTGQSFSQTLQMDNPDTSSAEWIAEAPSTTTQNGGLQTLPLANFGTVSFSNASATAGGHTGSISDPSWNVKQVQLRPDAPTGYPGAGNANSFFTRFFGVANVSGGGASPSELSSDGSSFSVTYTP